jgi:hypothetical protein
VVRTEALYKTDYVVFKGLICYCVLQSQRPRPVALTGMSVGICTWCHDSVKPNLSWEMRQFRRYAERTRQGRNRRNKERDGETRQKHHGNNSCNREAAGTLFSFTAALPFGVCR